MIINTFWLFVYTMPYIKWQVTWIWSFKYWLASLFQRISMLTGTSEWRRHLSLSVKLLSLRIKEKFVLILINTLFPMALKSVDLKIFFTMWMCWSTLPAGLPCFLCACSPSCSKYILSFFQNTFYLLYLVKIHFIFFAHLVVQNAFYLFSKYILSWHFHKSNTFWSFHY